MAEAQSPGQITGPNTVNEGDAWVGTYNNPNWTEAEVEVTFTSGSGHTPIVKKFPVVNGEAQISFVVPAEWIQFQVNAPQAPQKTVDIT